jgi:hypothetical protein
MMARRLLPACNLLLFASLAFPTVMAEATTISYDFNDFLPPVISLYGSAFPLPDIGVDDSGGIQLTQSFVSDWGACVLVPLDDLDVPVTSFVARFKVRISDSLIPDLPADGFSFNFSSAVPNPPTYGNPGEEGLPIGLSVNFDTWDNGIGDYAPGIDVKYNSILLAASVLTNPYTGPRFADVVILLEPDGTLDVDFDGLPVFRNVPTGHVATMGGQFVFGARTGAAAARHIIDDLEITTNPVPEPTTLFLAAMAGVWFVAMVRGPKCAIRSLRVPPQGRQPPESRSQLV